MFPLAVLGALPSVFQSIQGISQMVNGRRQLNGLQRPTYEIPTAVRQQLALAQAAYADPKMPGENQAYNRVGAAYSNLLRAGRDGGNPGAMLAMAQANANRGYNDLATQSAQYQRQDQQNLMSNLGNYAQYQDQAWQQNKFAPYVDQYNEGRERIGAGRQNLFGGLNGMASVGMQMLAARQQSAKPVDAAQIQNATGEAQTSSLQDQYLQTVQRMMQGGLNTAQKATGMNPAQMMSAYQNLFQNK